MTGIERIAAERARQVEQEGWTPEHDASHVNGELAQAAAYYCVTVDHEEDDLVARDITQFMYPDTWPRDGMKRSGLHQPSDRDLEKAGALIAAELDRRAALSGKEA